MDRYTIYCTEEQTRKALELGAPIDKTHANPSMSFVDKHPKRFWVSTDDGKIDVGYVLGVPTAEQMIGWLEEQKIIVYIYLGKLGYEWGINRNRGLFRTENLITYELVSINYDNQINSRKEATLAAIDAALDYLIENK